MRRNSLVATLTVALCLVGASSALAWNSHGDFLSCGEADFSGVTAEKGWKLTQITDGVVTKTKVFDVAKAGNISWPVFATLGAHYVSVTLANAKDPHDGYSEVHSTFIDCVAPSASSSSGPPGPPGPKGDPGTPGKDGVGYDCTGTAVPTGGAPALCPGTPGRTPKLATCTSQRVYHVKVANRFRGQKVHSALLIWDNGTRRVVAKRSKDGRLRANVSFKDVVSPLRGLWTVSLRIVFDGGKRATLTRNVRLCSPSDGNLNFATDVHRDGV